MTDCIFCRIIANEIPHEKVYEDENVCAFLDRNPCNPGHTLIVPKEHADNLQTASVESLQSIIAVVPKLARAIFKAFDYTAYNLQVNCGVDAGQVVQHLHFHLIPRMAGDGHELFHGRAYEDGGMAEAGEKIRTMIKLI